MKLIDADALLKKTINNPLHVPYITKKDVIDMPSALNNQVNLCDSCTYTYPECPSEKDDVIFGNGIGNDNICACNKYQPTVQPVATDTNVGDKISKFIDGLEEIFADLRERHVDDSVCGLCEYDGAYMGQSGDWCNECPGFYRDDCFKLSDETRKEWTDEIIKALPTVQPETLTDKEQRIFLAAMGREEKVCRHKDSLVRTCHEITRKVKGALWT